MFPWKLIVLSGASGAGKTTLASMIEAEIAPAKLCRLRSLTTREKRPHDESNLFTAIPLDWFDSMATCRPGFLWVKVVHGHKYGTLRNDLEKALAEEEHTLAIITPDHLSKLHLAALEMGCTTAQMLFLHILSPGESVLRSRLVARGDAPDSIERRIEDCRNWDESIKSLILPIKTIRNDNSKEELQARLKKILKGQ